MKAGDSEDERRAKLLAFGKNLCQQPAAPDFHTHDLSSTDIIRCLHENEDGDAKIFIHLFKDQYRFDVKEEQWYYWNDHYWRKDRFKQSSVDIEIVSSVYAEELNHQQHKLALSKDENEQKNCKYLIHQLQIRRESLHTLFRKKNVITRARMGIKALAIDGTEWDSNPWLLGCKNGVIDLRTGNLHQGQRDEYIKNVVPLEYTGLETPRDEWVRFLYDIQDQNKDIVEYLQRLLGYGITGLSNEPVYPVLWGGKGRNGKTTMLETLADVLGQDLAYKAPASFVLQNKQQAPASGSDASMVKMRGKRIVWCSETNDGDRIDASRIKELSGNDAISCRAPYAKEQLTFKPSHLMLLLTNHRPKMPAADKALWHRVHLIPFLFSYYTNPDLNDPFQRKKDPGLEARLRTKDSKQGILAWLVKGCIKYQEQGLNPPEAVIASTSDYHAHEDRIGEFIEECCVKDQYAKIRITDIYKRYKDWSKDSGYTASGKQKFFDELGQRFQISIKDGYKQVSGLREIII